MKWVHELDVWPDLAWDESALAADLGTVRNRQGRLLGRMESLGFDLQTEAHFKAMVDEVVKTAAIEGERLELDEVRSSLARYLGMDIAGLPQPSREVDGVVEMMIDATQHYEKALSAKRLYGWHAALFPTGWSGRYQIKVGGWRTADAGPMQVVSGALGNERVHFEAPEAGRLKGEMSAFIKWYNQQSHLDAVLKAALAHFRFVTIHPFDDGNGRIARAIAEMSLTRSDGTPRRFYSMSAQLEAERKDYYQQLETAQRGNGDITHWMSWFLGCFDRCLDAADKRLESVLRKARIWKRANEGSINERQRLVLNRMLDQAWEGNLTNAKYAKLAKCSGDTALRDIGDLLERNILIKNPGGGRSTSYRINDE